jgi:hypothetical protein
MDKLTVRLDEIEEENPSWNTPAHEVVALFDGHLVLEGTAYEVRGDVRHPIDLAEVLAFRGRDSVIAEVRKVWEEELRAERVAALDW